MQSSCRKPYITCKKGCAEMKKFSPISKDFPHFLHGGDYNPEQWIETPEIWDEDMALMKEAHTNEFTVGIFSWAEIEKEEGVFDFSWLDTIIGKIHKAGGKVVLATPSAARPKWLSDKYPEVLRVNETLSRNKFSTRHNHCYTSPVYRDKVRIIDEKLSERYGKHPAVVAWHISNEFNGRCYCDLCAEEFRNFLRRKFDNDIDKLNHEYWTRFWSHRFGSFEEIEPPRTAASGSLATGPAGDSCVLGLNLAWKEFCSDQTIDFAAWEKAAIRKYSDLPVTTNCMPTHIGFDHYKMGKVLDVHSIDLYPRWSSGFTYFANYCAYHSTFCRGVKEGQPFMIMESAPGINLGSVTYHKVKSREEQLFEAVDFIAHGADTIQYFQWRKGRGAYEKNHGAVVDHYGKSDNRVFKMVKETGEMLEKLDGVIGTGVKAEAAVVYDYKTQWALDQGLATFAPQDTNGYLALTQNLFTALWNKNIPVDIISYDMDFSKYKVILLPLPYIMTEKIAEKIKKFVADGGTLISTCLAATANENDLNYTGGIPGAGLRELFGLRVDEVDYYGPGASKPNGVIYNGKEYPIHLHAEFIVPDDAKTLMSFTDDILKDSPAVLKKDFGKGTSYYIGFNPGLDFLSDFVPEALASCGVMPLPEITGDEFIRVTKREGDGEEYFFVMNVSGTEEQNISLNESFTDMLTGEKKTGALTLPAKGFMILAK